MGDIEKPVLVVEDEPIIRMALTDHLASHGFPVLEAGSGDQALEMIRSGARIAAIVTDIRMPGRVNGIDLALWTREHHPQIKIVVVSGEINESPALSPLGDEGRVISKPYPYDRVIARLRELLGQ